MRSRFNKQERPNFEAVLGSGRKNEGRHSKKVDLEFPLNGDDPNRRRIWLEVDGGPGDDIGPTRTAF